MAVATDVAALDAEPEPQRGRFSRATKARVYRGVGQVDRDPESLREETRTSLAWVVVIGYLGLVLVNIATPLALLMATSATAAQAKDLTLAISGALTGLTGVLGFVVGYYFKTEEQQRRRTTKKPPAQSVS